MSGDLHLTPWGIDALDVVEATSCSLHAARDWIIFKWLQHGDTRPFTDWILRGHRPSQRVLCAVAIMMTRGNDPRFDPASIFDPQLREIADLFPLNLTVKGKGERKGDSQIAIRNGHIALAVEEARASGKSKAKALAAVHHELQQIGSTLKYQTVEYIYTNHKSGPEMVELKGWSLDEARDLVILVRLLHGDTTAFADCVLASRRPAHDVLRAVAIMMIRGDNPHFAPADLVDPELQKIAARFPLELRTNKKNASLEKEVRDRCIGREVRKRMLAGESYEKAIFAVTDWLEQGDGGEPIAELGVDAVEKAYKKNRR